MFIIYHLEWGIDLCVDIIAYEGEKETVVLTML